MRPEGYIIRWAAAILPFTEVPVLLARFKVCVIPMGYGCRSEPGFLWVSLFGNAGLTRDMRVSSHHDGERPEAPFSTCSWSGSWTDSVDPLRTGSPPWTNSPNWGLISSHTATGTWTRPRLQESRVFTPSSIRLAPHALIRSPPSLPRFLCTHQQSMRRSGISDIDR